MCNECTLRSDPSIVLQVINSVTKCEELSDVHDQLECLRAIPASELAKATNSFPVNIL